MYLASQAGPAVRHGTIALGRAAIVAAVVAALLFALAPAIGGGADAVSYTHLTLPTNREV